VCFDPFTADVNAWAWERPLKLAGKWQFLRLERGRPTIFDRFLANVAAAGHADIVLPVNITSIVGVNLLRHLYDEQRIFFLPEVIYLDSAHQAGETFLELQKCWELLQPGGVLMGDDWSWSTVRRDVLRFLCTIEANPSVVQRLAERLTSAEHIEGALIDRNQWVIAK
jgi:hypothetical protein